MKLSIIGLSSSLFHFGLLKKKKNRLTKAVFSFQGLDLFAAMFNSFRLPDGQNKLPVCSWLVVTLLNNWVCVQREGGTRGREPPSCLPSFLFLLLTTEHCSLLENMSTFTQSEWIPLGLEVICDLLWSRERRWWSGGVDLGVSL